MEKKRDIIASSKTQPIENRINKDFILHLQSDRGMSLAEIARAMQVSRSHVTRVRDGTKGLSLRSVAKVAEALGEDISSLFKGITIMRRLPKAPNKSDKALHKAWAQSAKLDKEGLE